MKMFARSTTSRKNITLTLAKKFQLKFAHFLLQPTALKIITKEKHKIQSKNILEICRTLDLNPSQFSCYNELELNGVVYKEGYYLSKFNINEMNLFKIVETISVSKNYDTVFILCESVLLKSFDAHYESYLISDDENVLSSSIYSANDFSGPPINVTNVATGKKMVRLKQF